MGPTENSKKRNVVAIVLAALGIAMVALIARGLYPAALPTRPAPFIDTIFANPLVIWAARLLLISGSAVIAFGGVFISLSIAIRIKNGEWLHRAGPFEVSDRAGATSQRDEWLREREAWAELRARIAGSDGSADQEQSDRAL